ncbi:MAG: alpha/beta fold hydrolase [Gammaproteobacteria bacterium]|nr:alpha/beta fold hydrolase [Gammaproteobacteria bacterium]MBU1440378.1 alpha/beta fold hydrolase [Gammaproteobacteria bacterium]
MEERLDWDLEGPAWPHHEHSRFVEAAGVRWHVQRLGSGPALLLLHGTGASAHSFRDLVSELATDFDCVAIDLPGHAFTSLPSARALSLRSIASGVSALMSTLRFSPRVVVGHSAGAAIGAQMCLDGGVSPSLLFSINGALLPLEGLSGLLFPPIAKALAATPLPSWLFARGVGDRQSVERLIRRTGSELDAQGVDLYAKLVRHPAHARAALAMMAGWRLGRLERHLKDLKPHLYLLAASNDLAVPAEVSRRVRDGVAGAEMSCIDDAGHLVHEERPAQVAALIRASAARVGIGRPGARREEGDEETIGALPPARSPCTRPPSSTARTPASRSSSCEPTRSRV